MLTQSHFELEIIVINDGSKDSSLEKASQINDPRIKIFSYPNSGVAVSRNRGIDLAKGDYISFLDADDLWTTEKLEDQLKALRENHQAAVAYSWTDYIDESGNFLYPGSHLSWNGDVFSKLLLKNFIENGSNPLIRRGALAEVGKFDSSLPPVEDWDMWLRLAARYHFVAVPRSQVLYRMSANANSANISKMETQGLKILNRAFSLDPLSLQHLRKSSFGNFYQYLTFRSLTSYSTRQECLVAARCFVKAIAHNPNLLRRHRKLMLIVFFKIVLGIVFSPKSARFLITTLNKFTPSSSIS
ncbi:glycosyltransferase [Laspinema sp. C5]|nr:glycosyltransferase [Laspinema sp. D3c]